MFNQMGELHVRLVSGASWTVEWVLNTLVLTRRARRGGWGEGGLGSSVQTVYPCDLILDKYSSKQPPMLLFCLFQIPFGRTLR